METCFLIWIRLYIHPHGTDAGRKYAWRRVNSYTEQDQSEQERDSDQLRQKTRGSHLRGTTSVARMWVQEVCTYAADWSKRALMPLTTLNTERVDGVQPQRYSRVLERNPKLIHCKRLLPAAKHMAEHHGGGQR